MDSVRSWIPVSTSPKGRLVLAAVEQFGAHPFEQVTVGALAEAAGVTTGALYHHFGSKIGLYSVVRGDVEQRLIDRMEGALAVAPADSHTAPLMAALLVGFDFAIREGFPYLLGEPSPDDAPDRLARFLTDHSGVVPASPVLGRVLAATWRSAVLAVTDGAAADEARSVLGAIKVALTP